LKSQITICFIQKRPLKGAPKLLLIVRQLGATKTEAIPGFHLLFDRRPSDSELLSQKTQPLRVRNTLVGRWRANFLNVV
jgi:hypothetical protein